MVSPGQHALYNNVCKHSLQALLPYLHGTLELYFSFSQPLL